MLRMCVLMAAAGLMAGLSWTVQAAEYRSPAGDFSLTYPDSWKVADQERREEVHKTTKSMFDEAGIQKRLTPSHTIISNPASPDFADNVNIIVRAGTATVKEGSEDEVVKELRQGFEKLGWKVSGLQAEQVTVAGCKAVSVKYAVSVPQKLSKPLRQWQIVVPGKAQIFTITCSSLEPNYATAEPEFEAMFKSLRIDLGPEPPK